MSEHEFNIENLSSTEIKSKIQRDGIWPQYTQRIKSLERAEREFWKLFEQETDSTRKQTLLEDLVNLQPVISRCYDTAQTMLQPNVEIKN